MSAPKQTLSHLPLVLKKSAAETLKKLRFYEWLGSSYCTQAGGGLSGYYKAEALLDPDTPLPLVFP